MMTPAPTSITVRVLIAMRHRGGRKMIITPDSAATPGAAVRTRGDPVVVKALARAHRWRRLLEGGRYRSVRELAAAEKVDRAFIGRTLRLTLLAPDIVEAALVDGRAPADLTLLRLLEPFPTSWAEQRALFFCQPGTYRGAHQ